LVLLLLLLLLLGLLLVVHCPMMHFRPSDQPAAVMHHTCDWHKPWPGTSAGSAGGSRSSSGGGCRGGRICFPLHRCRQLWQHLLQHLILLCVSCHRWIIAAGVDAKLWAKAPAAAARHRLFLLLLLQ
jgi:hypothetical protein